MGKSDNPRHYCHYHEGKTTMKTDLKTLLDLAAKIIQAANVLVEEPKPKKKSKSKKGVKR